MRGANFARACAIEMRMGISQEPFYAEIYRENAAPQSGHLDQTPALTFTAHCLGGKSDGQRRRDGQRAEGSFKEKVGKIRKGDGKLRGRGSLWL